MNLNFNDNIRPVNNWDEDADAGAMLRAEQQTILKESQDPTTVANLLKAISSQPTTSRDSLDFITFLMDRTPSFIQSVIQAAGVTPMIFYDELELGGLIPANKFYKIIDTMLDHWNYDVADDYIKNISAYISQNGNITLLQKMITAGFGPYILNEGNVLEALSRKRFPAAAFLVRNGAPREAVNRQIVYIKEQIVALNKNLEILQGI